MPPAGVSSRQPPSGGRHGQQPARLVGSTTAFIASVVRLLDDLKPSKAAREVEGQLLRSATGVGANYEEARGADSRADFCNKLQIAFKEMRETHFWLCLADRAELLNATGKILPLLDEATQLRAILGKSIATARGKARSAGDHAGADQPAG